MSRLRKALLIAGALLVLELAHDLGRAPSEPFFNNDESRHVMTGVYFRDLFADWPFDHVRDYTVRYYLQYPALGLLVWPPFFYVVEGLCMLVLGTSVVIAKGVILAFAGLACVYLYRLVCHTHDVFTALVATLFFGLAPLVFAYSRQVMLEMPTLALALMSIYYFVRYLDLGQRRDVAVAALTAALAGLTRFDAAYLAPFFGVLLIARRQLSVLRRKSVWVSVVLALAMVLPVYISTAREFGWVHAKSIQDNAAGPLEALTYYPRCLPEQIGWSAVALAVVGLMLSVQRQRRHAAWPYLAMVLTIYLVFTPMGEREPRHTIYWVPAFALFAAEGCRLLGLLVRWPRLRLAVPVLALAVTGWVSCSMPAPYVRGYEAAAYFVVGHTTDSPCCLFDSYLNGDFIYHVRRADPERRLWVLRGDKLFYSMLSDPAAGYTDHARTKEEVLALLTKFDPEWIVVEEPQIHYTLAGATTLRAVLREHPEQFRLEVVVDLTSNVRMFQGVQLLLYRNTQRNYEREPLRELEMLGLGHKVGTAAP